MKKLVLISLLTFAFYFVQAQTAKSYSFQYVEQTFVELTDPTVVGANLTGTDLHGKVITGNTGVAYGTPSPTPTYIDAAAIDIGFNFSYNEQQMNKIAIMTNGTIYFGKDVVPTMHTNTAVITNYYLKNMAAAQFSGNIRAGEKTQISYKGTTRATDNKKLFTVEYKNILIQTSNSPQTYDTASFQIVICEDQTIAFNFKTMKYSGQSYGNSSFSIGIQQNNTDYSALTTNVNNAEVGWKNAVKKQPNSWKDVSFSSTSYPEVDMSYVFTPPAPCVAPTTTPEITLNTPGAYDFSGTIDLKSGADDALVLFQEGKSVTVSPVNQTTYKVGDVIGTAKVIALGTSFSAQSLTPSTEYSLIVIPYNEVCKGGPLYTTTLTSQVVKTGFDAPSIAKSNRTKNSITLKTQKNGVGSNIITFMASEFKKNLSFSDFTNALSLTIGDSVKVNNVKYTLVQKGNEGDVVINNLKTNSSYYFYSWSYENTSVSNVYSVEAEQTWSELPTIYNSSSWVPFSNGIGNLRIPAGWTTQTLGTLYSTMVLGGMGGDINVLGSDHNTNLQEELTLLKSDVITPGIVLKSGKHKLKFDLCFTNNTGQMGAMIGKGLQTGDTLFVQVSDDLQNFTTIKAIHSGNYSNTSMILQAQNINFSGFENKTVHVRFLFVSPNRIGPKFNNIKVEQTLDCDYPVNIEVVEGEVGTDFAKIQWTNSNFDQPMAWNIKLFDVKLGEYTPAKIYSGADNSARIENLTAATKYQAQVQAVCAANDSSFWSDLSPIFLTQYGLPFSENWDEYEDEDINQNGWTLYEKQFTGESITLPPTEDEFVNGWSIGYYAEDWDNTPAAYTTLPSGNSGNWLISPSINMGQGNEIVKMNLQYYIGFGKFEDKHNDKVRFMVLVSTDNGLNWKLSDTIFSKTYFEAPEETDTLSIQMKNYKGNIKIAFYLGSTQSVFGGMFSAFTIDNFSLEYSCTPPSNLSATPGEDTCLIAWKTKGTNSIVRYKKAADATYTTLASSEKTMILRDLAPETKYQYGVRNVCAEGDSSVWTSSTFETLEAYVCDTVTGHRHSALTKTSANIIWTSDAEKFNIKWKEAAAQQWTEVSTTAKILALSGLKTGTSYEYQIQAVCDSTDDTDKSLWTKTKRFGTLNITCPIPQNYHNIGATWQSLRFAWVSDANQVIFAIREESETNFQYYVLGKADTLTISNLNQNTMHITKIAALCAVGDTSEWTPEVRSTTVYPECEAPVNLSATALSANSVRISWEDAKKQHKFGWRVAYRTSAASRFDTIHSIILTYHTLSNLASNTAYVWKVQGHCDNLLSSPYTELSSFNTTSISADSKAEDFSVFANQGQINIINPKSTMIDKVDILSVNGQLINEFQINSPENVIIPLQLSKSIIIVKITTKGKVYSYKLIMN